MNSLNEFEKKLRRFSLESKLEVCRKIAHTLDYNVPPLKPLKIFNNPQQNKIYDELKRTSHLFEIEYLALASTVNGEWSGPLTELSDYNEYRKIINQFKDYGATPEGKNINDPGWYMYFLRLGLQQHKTLDILFKNLLRYHFFFNYTEEHFDLKKEFLSEFEYDFSNYVLFVICLFTLSSKSNSPLSLNLILNSLSSLPNLPKYMIEDMINILSCYLRDFVKIHGSYKVINRKYRNYDYNPFTKFPILKYEDLLLIPIPQYLFGAITEGFYHRLCEAKGLEFRSKFGRFVLESYIGKILKWKSNDYIIIPEFCYGKKSGKKSPDYILVKGRDLIFIEVKAATPAISLRGNDFRVSKKQFVKGFGEGILQCIKKEHDLLNGDIQHELIPLIIDNIYYIVVNLEDFYIPPGKLITDMVKELCDERNIKYINNRKPLMISVSLLETILEVYDGDIFDFMKAWCNDSKIKFPDTYIDFSKVNVKELRSYKYFISIIASTRGNNERLG
ncbi:MAG: hypothetical protein KAW92_00620 [Candidatus Cloacimonetes bacterium]|nr:hypothetical protein [Candidatus Cloacimonadota bacterium]